MVFYSSSYEKDGEVKYVRGMVRRNEAATRFHCGEAVAKVATTSEEIQAELAGWYRHPAGFMAGISEKAGGAAEPAPVPMTEIAKALFG